MGLPAAFPPQEVAARGVYDATAVASGLGTPGPPCPFRPALRVTGNIKWKGIKRNPAEFTRSAPGLEGCLDEEKKGRHSAIFNNKKNT